MPTHHPIPPAVSLSSFVRRVARPSKPLSLCPCQAQPGSIPSGHLPNLAVQNIIIVVIVVAAVVIVTKHEGAHDLLLHLTTATITIIVILVSQMIHYSLAYQHSHDCHHRYI